MMLVDKEVSLPFKDNCNIVFGVKVLCAKNRFKSVATIF